MPKLLKHCPTLYEILVGEDKDGVMEMDFGRSEEECEHGFGVEVKISEQLPLVLCITPAVVNKAEMETTNPAKNWQGKYCWSNLVFSDRMPQLRIIV